MSKILIAFLGLGLLTATIAPAEAGTCYYHRDWNGRVTSVSCN